MTPEPRTRTRLDPAIRRRQIAEAAARVFAEHDPADVSFEAVADEAGVSRSLVYTYFGDRGSLFAAAYTVEMMRLDTEIDGALEKLGNNRERLAQAVTAYLRFAARHRERWNLIASAGSSRHPAVRDAIAARTVRIADTLGGSAEARLLVSGVIGMLEAAAAHVLEDDADPDELAELLTQVIWAGVSSFVPD
ncbi:MAG: TetR/AcrR family transcriptional regulator [Acidimicrobiales bacterium]|nr:TetR/AcrR family transcriptional regulator [Acidimicrobiales bacterium]